MFKFFKKKPLPAPPAPAIERQDEFSTGFIYRSKPINRQEVIKRSIQVDINKMKPIDQYGVAMDDLNYGDTSNIQNVKYMNQQGAYGQLPDLQLCWYASQGFIGYQNCSIIAQNWLVDKACSMPAMDAVRNGYCLTQDDGEELEAKFLAQVKDLDAAMLVNSNLVDLIRFKNIFGIRIAYFKIDTDDEDFYQNPFNIDGVQRGSYKGIKQIDPYWITPVLDGEGATNPASPNFYRPTWWLVNGRRIHHSHLIIVTTGSVSDILKPTYFYGGIPLTQRIAERVYAAEKTANEAPMLAMAKRVYVQKVDAAKAISNQEAFTSKMQFQADLQNNWGIKAIDLEEEFQQHETSLNDLDAVIMTQYQIVSAIAEVPATKLLGTSPKGFGAAGEYEESSYHEKLSSIQENELSPFLLHHYELLFKSEYNKKLKIGIKWNPTNEMTAEQLADVNLKKAQTASVYSEIGAVSGQDVREMIVKDKNSDYTGIAIEGEFSNEEEGSKEEK